MTSMIRWTDKVRLIFSFCLWNFKFPNLPVSWTEDYNI